MRVPELPDRYGPALERAGFRKLGTPRDPSCLTPFYSQIPSRYPRLFEALCLGYSWQEAVLGEVEFAPNPAGVDLAGLATSIRYDRHLWNLLVSSGYLVFGRMSGGRYDPVAFNMGARKGHDAPVCRVDHEEILSFQRRGHPVQLVPSFFALLDAAARGGEGAA
jgi:hypothetical protein